MSRRGDFRVLVVDDYEDTADSMATLIRYWGYDAAMCQDGASVLETALLYRPMVVLLDIGLPDVDGFQVARLLRGQPELGNLVIIGISGYGSAQYRVRALTGGFDHYHVKPVEPDELAELLGRISLPRAESASPRGMHQPSGVRA